MSGLRVLIVGGYGTFGGRLVELLRDVSGLTLIVAGRSRTHAVHYCGRHLNTAAVLKPARFDRNGDVAAQLAALKPDVVVDASGPFQDYGTERYRLIEVCIAAGLNYIDLADGSAFVEGVPAFDARAREAGVYVLSGASTCPVLTAAVVRRLARGMAQVLSVRGGIGPSPFSGVGENVNRAIGSYAGQRVDVWRDGRTSVAYPFTEQCRRTVAPPGRIPLQNRLFSLVDVPDSRVLPRLWPELREVWFGAAPVPEVLHRVLIGLAWLVRWRIAPSLTPLARIMHWATNHVRWGAHRGGMFVEVEGATESGAPLRRSWHLLAEGDDGPLIPSMAAAALIRAHLADAAPSPGARAAVNDLKLSDYEAAFATRKIHSGEREELPASAALYRRLLGPVWDELPPAVRAMHDGAERASGRASVKRGGNPLSWFAGAIMGFPRAGEDIAIQVRFTHAAAAEIWTRTFAGKSFSSRQYAGRGKSEHLLCERFGPLAFAMALVFEAGRLRLVVRRWTAFGIALPLWLAPRSEAHESEENGVFRFHVAISHPLCGLIVRYQGSLTPDVGARAEAA